MINMTFGKIIKLMTFEKCSLELSKYNDPKKSRYRFCKNIFTPQTYGVEKDRKTNKCKPYKKYNKRIFLKMYT